MPYVGGGRETPRVGTNTVDKGRVGRNRDRGEKRYCERLPNPGRVRNLEVLPEMSEPIGENRRTRPCCSVSGNKMEGKKGKERYKAVSDNQKGGGHKLVPKEGDHPIKRSGR